MNRDAAGTARPAAAKLTATAILAALAAVGPAVGEARAAAVLPTVSTGAARAGELRIGDARRVARPAWQRHLLLLPVRAHQDLRRPDDDRRRGRGHAHGEREPRDRRAFEPLSVYHYRLVAVNGAGAAIGQDRTLLDHEGPALAADPHLAQPRPLRRPGGRSGHALGHRKRQSRGRPAGQRVPLLRGLSERRQPGADDRHRRASPSRSSASRWPLSSGWPRPRPRRCSARWRSRT